MLLRRHLGPGSNSDLATTLLKWVLRLMHLNSTQLTHFSTLLPSSGLSRKLCTAYWIPSSASFDCTHMSSRPGMASQRAGTIWVSSWCTVQWLMHNWPSVNTCQINEWISVWVDLNAFSDHLHATENFAIMKTGENYAVQHCNHQAQGTLNTWNESKTTRLLDLEYF